MILRPRARERHISKLREGRSPQDQRILLGRTTDIDEKQARTALDEIVAALNKSPSEALGGELVRRFVTQVYVPQKYDNGDWRENTKRKTEGLFWR